MYPIQIQKHHVDSRGRGALLLVWPVDYNLETMKTAIGQLERALQVAESVVVFNDIRGIRMPKATERVFIGEWIENRKEFLARKIACWVDVSESAMLRGALKLVQFWGKDSYPREIVGSADIPILMAKYMPDYKKEVRLPSKDKLFSATHK